MPALSQEKLYTIDDIYNLKDGERAELVDGHIYYMSPPDTKHQRILNFINTEINIYIRKNNGGCEVFTAPLVILYSPQYLHPWAILEFYTD